MNNKTLKIVLLNLAKGGLVLCVLASLVGIGYFAWRLLWFLVQWSISPAHDQFGFMLEVADQLPEELGGIRGAAHALLLGTTAADAKAAALRFALLIAGCVGLLLLSCWLLKKLEHVFKRSFLPEVLQDRFTEISYEPEKRRSYDEPLIALGLLHSFERYYSANRLKGLYRGCWVAAEEIVCGGVYLNKYTSHRVKVRGQWITIRLNRDFDATVVLRSKGTKNQLAEWNVNSRMVEVVYENTSFAESFSCYTDAPELINELLDRDMAEKLLHLLELYPDLCVILENGSVHFLIRRRSFDRRWEVFIPFLRGQLSNVANRLYGPLQDVTDELLR